MGKIGGNEEYGSQVLELVREGAETVWSGGSLQSEIDACRERVKAEFLAQYGDGDEGIALYRDNQL